MNVVELASVYCNELKICEGNFQTNNDSEYDNKKLKICTRYVILTLLTLYLRRIRILLL